MTFDEWHLAAIYDGDNPDGPDHDFFRALVAETDATRIADVGCGTGLLTVTLADRGRRVVGIDPARAMLEVARHRPRGGAVHWVVGTADVLRPKSVDMVLMTGNVAMHLIGEAWHRSLHRIAEALVPGGRVAFESRNPEAQAWKKWSQPPAERETAVGTLRESTVVEGPDEHGVVVMYGRNEFLADGAVIEAEAPLQFRTYGEIVEDLARVGLRVRATYRNWCREPFTGGSSQPLMVFDVEK